MTPRILLFDIDGTLVSCGGAGRRALGRAFLDLYGRRDVLEFSFGGLTDRAIVRAGLAACAAAEDEPVIDRLIARYLEHLPETLQDSCGYRVMPGVTAVVPKLAGMAGIAVGLGTGNVRLGATAKLARGGLHLLFPFGGFGCDHEQRSELLAIGARRGAERLGAELLDCRVIVVGDTPRDVAAALAIGATAVAVATGDHEAGELAAAGAEIVLSDLEDARAWAALVGS
jgi:phosphoglycolate phosphatase